MDIFTSFLPYMTTFQDEHTNWIILVLLLVISFINKSLSKFILYLIRKMARKVNSRVFNAVLDAFEVPLRWIVIVTPIYIGIQTFELSPGVATFLSHLFRSSIVGFIGAGFIKLSSQSSIVFERLGQRFNFEIDKILIPFLSRVLQFIVFALVILVIAQEWGYNVQGFIAGLGLGGLAVALAAQDSLGNLFAGIVLLLEKPFDLGDWIQTPDVEGVVEEISFRSTRLRTFANALLIVPNSKLANTHITNWSRMGKRRITYELGISLFTPVEKIESVLADIRTMLDEHQGIHQETKLVFFDTFNASNFGIFMYFFTKTTAWKDYLAVKEDTNLQIIKILQKHEVELAQPSRSLYIEKHNEKLGKDVEQAAEQSE